VPHFTSSQGAARHHLSIEKKVKIIKKISQCRDDRKPELFSLNQQKLKTHADGFKRK
jgi:DNA-binding transcriptional ArsR family regulator